MKIQESELILNPDGSVYHLHLKPGQVANTVITVGDSDRVEEITKHFEEVEFTIQNREFKTQTGSYKGNRITVISTGIGTDNIDIVLNEMDAVVNIDLEKRLVKKALTSLDIIRVGTSGSIQENIPLDSFVVSKMAIGFDSVLHFYENESIQEKGATEAFIKHANWFTKKSDPYIIASDETLSNKFKSTKTRFGITATNVGFYGPQGRVLRLPLQDPEINTKLATFTYKDLFITNMEMETAGIYGLSKLLGHKAVSLNAIIANRVTGNFTKNPAKLVEELIQFALERIIK
ncbi:MAG: phosphorylase [Bacteroidetes bacterium HGW-Bacteroidetes-2]|jgi:uridine phosphorylase|nr:MAG: phosphorylase [Bacteroidetes bacterium HGW-Bacteroidetes-2]